MKIAVAKEQLLQGLQAVQNVVSVRRSFPILSNVLLEAKDGGLRFTATDLEITISCVIPVDMAEPGATTVPAKRLLGITRELSSPEVEIETSGDDGLSVRSGSSYFKLRTLPADEFPPAPTLDSDASFSLPQDGLKLMLKQTAYAISYDETRYVLNGVLALRDSSEGKLALVATDGRRMALVENQCDMPAELDGQSIVPTKAVNELQRLLASEGSVSVTFTDKMAGFRLENDGSHDLEIATKLIDGKFPNFRQVIPSEAKERIPLIREELLVALRRAELMTSEKMNSVKITFSDNRMTINANTPEVGEAEDSLAINYQGPSLAVAFNPSYLLDPLKALDDDEVCLELIDELSPGVIRSGDTFLYVIMPMRIPN